MDNYSCARILVLRQVVISVRQLLIWRDNCGGHLPTGIWSLIYCMIIIFLFFLICYSFIFILYQVDLDQKFLVLPLQQDHRHQLQYLPIPPVILAQILNLILTILIYRNIDFSQFF